MGFRAAGLWTAVLVLSFVTLVVPALGARAPEPPLAGRVTDQSGQALPGVTVEITAGDKATTLTTITDKDGRYAFESLAAGPYTMTFSEMNFAELRRRDVVVAPAAPRRVDVSLQLAFNATVVVTGRNTFSNIADLDHPEENLVGIAAAASEGAVTGHQIESRPTMRAGEVLETVPGVIISQHSGEGKANQYYLRGFNLDHGTDFATTVAGLPVNLPSNAHGQGYSDLNFVIPELVTGVQFKKGPYYATEGDFSAAGSANINYANALPRPLVSFSTGVDGWTRALAAVSPHVERGFLLAALEINHNNGPWVTPDDYDKVNGVLRYSLGDTRNAFSITGLGYSSSWNSTDQVPQRAIDSGLISRFGSLDSSDGGQTARYSVVADYQHTSAGTLTRATAFASKYRLNLFSNFTYFLNDPVHGDQFEQADRRLVTGGRVSQTRKTKWWNRSGETTYGVELRNDDIPTVGLYHTEDRVRLSTTREDAVVETSAGAFVQNDVRWLPWLRTSVGLRFDGYRFDVASSDAANSGIKHSGLVSPKGGVILGPWSNTELYINAGTGFHSNDARGTTITKDPSTGEPASPVTPLVRARGAEIGVRTIAIPHVQSTLTLWRLDLASELVFAGDAGTTEASRPSRRYGIEWTNYVRLSPVFTIDADLALSHAQFTDASTVGNAIPGSAGAIASLSLTAERPRGAFGSIRLRYFGPRPLIEDRSVTSKATSLVNAQLGYHISPRADVVLDMFNLLNALDSDVDYFYTSRLPGEPSYGVSDIHTHPTLPRSVRVAMRIKF